MGEETQWEAALRGTANSARHAPEDQEDKRKGWCDKDLGPSAVATRKGKKARGEPFLTGGEQVTRPRTPQIRPMRGARVHHHHYRPKSLELQACLGGNTISLSYAGGGRRWASSACFWI